MKIYTSRFEKFTYVKKKDRKHKNDNLENLVHKMVSEYYHYLNRQLMFKF